MICKIHTEAGWDSSFSREYGVREAIKRQEKRNASSSCWRQGLSLIFFHSLRGWKRKGYLFGAPFWYHKDLAEGGYGSARMGKDNTLRPLEKMLKLKVKNHATHGPGFFWGQNSRLGLIFCVWACVCLHVNGRVVLCTWCMLTSWWLVFSSYHHMRMR